MQNNYKLFIGSNNKTGRLEKRKILKTANKYYPKSGYTFIKGFGIWQGEEENSGILEILTDNKKESRKTVFELAKELKQVLQQEAILIQEIPTVASLV